MGLKPPQSKFSGYVADSPDLNSVDYKSIGQHLGACAPPPGPNVEPPLGLCSVMHGRNLETSSSCVDGRTVEAWKPS